jgi:hypothetical protein
VAVARRSNLAIYAGAWLAVLAIYALALIANSAPVGLALRTTVAVFLPPALLGLAVLRLPAWLARRPPSSRLALHAAAMLGFVIACGLGWWLLVALDRGVVEGRFELSVAGRLLTVVLLDDGFVYGILLGVAYTLHNAERAAQAETLRARATLEALRAQLNPHFILNTFQALLGLVRRDPALAEAALERLGDLLRYSLRVHRDSLDEVPLRDEWAFVDAYLELERLRLGDRLRVAADVPGATLDFLVPSFAVQTLVENAVRHAIAQRAAGGLLQIRVALADGRLRVAVEDDGNGGASERGDGGAGMGLRLLRERVAALYGGAATLGIAASAAGTRVAFELPARRAASEEDA